MEDYVPEQRAINTRLNRALAGRHLRTLEAIAMHLGLVREHLDACRYRLAYGAADRAIAMLRAAGVDPWEGK